MSKLYLIRNPQRHKLTNQNQRYSGSPYGIHRMLQRFATERLDYYQPIATTRLPTTAASPQKRGAIHPTFRCPQYDRL